MGDMKLGIELVLKGAEQVASSLRGVSASVKGIGEEFRRGLSEGIDQAVREANRPLTDLKKVADEARKALSIRPDIEIEGEIEKTRKAYEDLKNSGQASAGELNRAKDSMKAKIGELRSEMGKWSGDWEALGKKAQEAGSKLQGVGAKAMIAGAPAFIAGKDAVKAEYDLAGIANTAGLDPAKATEAVAKWKSEINELARYTNQTQGELIGALGTFVAKGMDPDKALAMLRSVGRAATATGSAVNDIAESMFQAGEALKIPMSDATRSLDMMAAAGAAGSFELKNMAKDLPNLSAKYASLGGTGANALASITSGAQIAMKTTSDASIAANNFKNFLDKLAAPETIRNFDKMGVNLTEQVKKGIDSGDLVGHMGKVIQDMTQGKAENLGKLFTDVQARDYALAISQHLDEYKRIRGNVMEATGTIDKQAAVMAATTQEKIKSIGISLNTALDEATMFKTALDGIKKAAEWFASNPDIFGPIATAITALALGGAGIVVVGTGLSAIGTAIGVISTAWGAAAAAVAGITTFATFLASAAGAAALTAAATALAAIAGAIAAFKVGFAFGTWLSEQIDLLVQSVTGDKAATLGGALYDMIEGPNGIITWFKSIPEKLGALWESTKAAAASLVAAMRDGFSAALKGELGIGAKLNGAIAYIRSTAKDWVQVGRDIIQGLLNGIQAKYKEVIAKIKGLGRDMLDSIMGVLDMHSPSKEFEKVGLYTAQGMSLGITKGTLGVKRSLEDMAAAALATGYSLQSYGDPFGGIADDLDAIAKGAEKAEKALAKMGGDELAEVVVVAPAKAPRNASGQFKSAADAAAQGSGFGGGVKEYVDMMKSASDTIKDVTVNAFKGMEDALTNFVKTGKLDFKSLADSIISDMVRMVVQQNITKPLAAAFGSMFGFAQGGTPGGTSAWRNQVVDSPTFFAFAKGGVMGEAGPEAIMPLTRGPDGNLGVRAHGSGGNVTVNVINNANGTKATARETTDGDGNKMIEVFIEQVKDAIASDITRGAGTVPDAMSSTYGLNRVAGAY